MANTTHPKDCPCKFVRLSFSSFTAAEYGDVGSLARTFQCPVASSTGRVGAASRATGGYTPLHLASQNGHAAATALLLRLGADVNGRSDDDVESGATPLHRAAFSGALSTIILLVNAHVLFTERSSDETCDLVARDGSFGCSMTPLHKAVAGGRFLAVGLILDFLRGVPDVTYGEDADSLLKTTLHIRDARARTPLDLALELIPRQDEECRSVRRWDSVASCDADWKKCAALLLAASNETNPSRQHNPTKAGLWERHEDQQPIKLPKLARFLQSDDLLTYSSLCPNDGGNPTLRSSCWDEIRQWEEEVKSVLATHCEQRIQESQAMRLVDILLRAGEEHAKAEVVSPSEAEDAPSNVELKLMKQTRPHDKDETGCATPMETELSAGQKCDECQEYKLTLFRHPRHRSKLVCRKCRQVYRKSR